MTRSPTDKPKLPILIAMMMMFVWLYGGAIVTGQFGQIGPDPDDVMRYVQIRDWLNGQSWFDTNQYRMGLASGTDMHWSRLPDVLIALLAWFFDLFTTPERALHLAISIWPPILGVIFLLILVRGADHLSDKKTRQGARWAVLGLGLVFICFGIRFHPGSIDHHNIQMVFLLAAIVGLLSVSSLRSGLAAGLSLAMATAIGSEVYPFVVLIAAFVASDWIWSGQDRRHRTTGFGLGFGLGLACLFVLTVAPAEFRLVYCDQLSLPILLVGVTGGLGLYAAAHYLSACKRWLQITTLAGIGALVLAQIVSIAPQCLGNPLNDLPETMHLFWLDHVTEAKPLGVDEINPWLSVPFHVGTAMIAIIVLFWRIVRKGPTSNDCLMLICLVCAVLLTIYQVRFFVFAQLFAILPLALWIAACFINGRGRESNIGYIGAIILSLPPLMGLPGILLAPAQPETTSENAIDCTSEDIISVLNDLPTGVLLAPTSEGSTYLKLTSHHVLSGNYHRNVDGLETSIRINAAGAKNDARNLAVRHNLDYILICSADLQADLIIEAYPQGLAADLRSGNIPNWLALEYELDEDEIRLFRILR